MAKYNTGVANGVRLSAAWLVWLMQAHHGQWRGQPQLENVANVKMASMKCRKQWLAAAILCATASMTSVMRSYLM
jgi:hypothetical protein